MFSKFMASCVAISASLVAGDGAGLTPGNPTKPCRHCSYFSSVPNRCSTTLRAVRKPGWAFTSSVVSTLGRAGLASFAVAGGLAGRQAAGVGLSSPISDRIALARKPCGSCACRPICMSGILPVGCRRDDVDVLAGRAGPAGAALVVAGDA